MQVNGKQYQTIWLSANLKYVNIIDQRKIPFKFEVVEVKSSSEMALVIKEMYVRGAGLIGVAAGYGMYLAVQQSSDWASIQSAAQLLKSTRPTAVNLFYAVDLMLNNLKEVSEDERLQVALKTAQKLAHEDEDKCRMIGLHGVKVIEELSEKKGRGRINILTHCNAGWLAFVDYGSALSPIYEAHKRGLDIHVYVDETRPRNQGARLTAWELGQQNIPHTVVADNVGGHLMQNDQVDMVIVGADRVAGNGDAANKIGTYLKALAARDNQIPFFVAFPSTTFDAQVKDGVKEIEIEERGSREVSHIEGWLDDEIVEVRLTPEGSEIANYGFDVTPARLISGWITENGIFDKASDL